MGGGWNVVLCGGVMRDDGVWGCGVTCKCAGVT